jgi:hypothetical protein
LSTEPDYSAAFFALLEDHIRLKQEHHELREDYEAACDKLATIDALIQELQS